MMNGFNPMMMLNAIIGSNPRLRQYYNMAQQLTQGKNPQQIQNTANNLLKQNGMDMGQVQNVINQFMGGNFNA